MTSSWFGVIEMSIFLGIPIVWGVWELVKLRREQARDREREQPQPPALPEDTQR